MQAPRLLPKSVPMHQLLEESAGDVQACLLMWGLRKCVCVCVDVRTHRWTNISHCHCSACTFCPLFACCRGLPCPCLSLWHALSLYFCPVLACRHGTPCPCTSVLSLLVAVAGPVLVLLPRPCLSPWQALFLYFYPVLACCHGRPCPCTSALFLLVSPTCEYFCTVSLLVH